MVKTSLVGCGISRSKQINLCAFYQGNRNVILFPFIRFIGAVSFCFLVDEKEDGDP